MPFSNHASMPGRTRSRTNWRTVSRIRRSSLLSKASTSRKSRGLSVRGARSLVVVMIASLYAVMRGPVMDKVVGGLSKYSLAAKSCCGRRIDSTSSHIASTAWHRYIGGRLRLRSHGKRRALRSLGGLHPWPRYLGQRVLGIHVAISRCHQVIGGSHGRGCCPSQASESHTGDRSVPYC